MDKYSHIISIAGQNLVFETGKLARHAQGSVTVRVGETILLATACRGEASDEEAQFLPLKVDYQEKFSAYGKTLGGFIKREGKPCEREILISRLIDRPLRPMFEKGYCNEVQILVYVLSYDGIHVPDPLAICAASAALLISEIPIIKPIGAVRVGCIEGKFVINPTATDMEKSSLDLILAGTEDGILMIEGYSDFLTEGEIFDAIAEGYEAVKLICKGLAEWRLLVGKPKKRDELKILPQEILKEVEDRFGNEIRLALHLQDKKERRLRLEVLKEELMGTFTEASIKVNQTIYSKGNLNTAFKEVTSRCMREMILKENRRIDGRLPEEVRPISIEMGLLPRTHGSAIFTRGETQALAVCTLGGEKMAQRYEDLLSGDSLKRFYLQYFFPPFSVGEVGRIGAPGRREIGHGKLAERSLAAALPQMQSFPYVIRLESNILESNGSSSMASVCGGCLALMEAGVPIKRPVAGIAMGLVLEGELFVVLSDIQGEEDALGDMDFKVAGDEKGVTAFQLDMKIEGITPHIIRVALEQARWGRTHILHKMLEACPASKSMLSQYAPRIETVQVKPSKIGLIIGPGGKQIRSISEESGASIDIADSGMINISSNSEASLAKAKELIYNLVAEVEVGKVYKGSVVSIVPFGVFVKIFEKEGLCHISEFDHYRINSLNEVCKEGDIIEVKVLDISDRGQIKLSRKATLPYPNAKKGGTQASGDPVSLSGIDKGKPT